MPGCCSSVLHVALPWPAACFCPQGNPANGACACMRRSLSPSPCVVWLYAYVCGLPGPCSSVRGLLTACPLTTAVYFTSVCTNWTLITRFLQLGQIRPQLQLSAAHGEAPKSWTRQDFGSWWIKTPTYPPPCRDSAFLSSPVPKCWVTGSLTQAYGCCKARLPVIMLSEACPHWPG